VFVTDLDGRVGRLLHGDRSEFGVVVVAEAAGPHPVETGLEAGDVIRAVDRTLLESVSQLREMVHNLKSADPVVLQVERGGRLQYLAFEME
jgi:S1-C subfamily serine protease